MDLLWNCTANNWTPAFGDHNTLGWATTLLYFGATLVCFRLAFSFSLSNADNKFERLFWISSAVLLALLAANKQLDVQTLLSSVGRCIARAQGWLGARRSVQFFVGIIVTGVLSLWGGWILFGLRHSLDRMWLPLLGILAVTAFFLLRMALFFHIYHTHVFGNNTYLSRGLEILGPIILIIAAIRAMQVTKPSRERK